MEMLVDNEKSRHENKAVDANTQLNVIYRTALIIGLFVGFYILSRFNYPLFHSFADMATVFMALGIFVLVWDRRRLLDNHYYLFVGIAFLFFAFWDFLHLLGNKGLGIFPQYGNMGPALYIISRYFLGISMLIAPLFIKHKLKTAVTLIVYFISSLVLVLSVFYWGSFPLAYIEGVGLTSFKVISDYIVCGILLGAVIHLWFRRRLLEARLFRLIMSSLALLIATGLVFTGYTDAYGVTNAVGHFLQIASFYLVYAAFVETILVKPQDILYRNLAQNEEKYHNLFNNMAEEVHLWQIERDHAGQILSWRLVDANPPALKTWCRQTVEEIRGKTADEILGLGSIEHYMPVVRKVMAEGAPFSYEDYFLNLNKYFRFTTVPLGEYFITTGADITAIKQADEYHKSRAIELEFAKKALEKEIDERRHIQANLENISTQHQLVLDAAQMGWWHFDPVSNYSRYDKRYKEIFEFSENGMDIDEIFASRLHPEDLPEVRAKIKAALDLDDPKPDAVEYRIIMPDGTIKWIESYGIATFEDAGSNRQSASLVGTVVDITERKKAEKMIMHQTGILRGINQIYRKSLPTMTSQEMVSFCLQIAKDLTQSQFGFIGELDSDGLLHDIALSDLGRETGMLLDKNDDGSLSGNFVIHELYERVMSSGKSLLSNIPSSQTDSICAPLDHCSVAEFLGIPLKYEGKVIGILALANCKGSYGDEELEAGEVLASVIVEALLRKRNDEKITYLASFPELNPNPIIEIDASSQIIYANPAARTRFCDLTPLSGRHPLIDNVVGLIEKEDKRTTSIDIKVEGNWYEQTIVYTPSSDKYRLYMRDISGRMKAEESLKRSNIELEAANKELEAFSYSVSHDLRAPLRSMDGYSSVLLENYADKLDSDGKRYLGYIQDASELMGKLIEDLLKLSKVSRSEMNFQMINLTDIAKKTVAELKKTDSDRTVNITIAPDMVAFGDQNLMRLVYANLLGNAWKFTRDIVSPQIEIGITMHNEKGAYFIRDNGAGLDMSYADKLFQPFQRLHKSTEFPGTGIGLSIVKRIIHKHGGEIWAESKVGEGATFYFTLG